MMATRKCEKILSRFQQLADAPARLVVEIELVTDECYRARERTRSWYKIVRAPHARGLLADLVSAVEDD